MGARLGGRISGSDDALVEAHELVEDELMSPADFRDFAFANAVRLHGGMNADIVLFQKSVVETLEAITG